MRGACARPECLTSRTRRACLGRTVTRVSDTAVPDAEFQAASGVAEKELVDLTIAIGLMNTFNWLAIGFRVPPAAAKSASSCSRAFPLAGKVASASHWTARL